MHQDSFSFVASMVENLACVLSLYLLLVSLILREERLTWLTVSEASVHGQEGMVEPNSSHHSSQGEEKAPCVISLETRFHIDSQGCH